MVHERKSFSQQEIVSPAHDSRHPQEFSSRDTATESVADGRAVDLISMWVRPQARGYGVGEALIAAVLDWARARQARSVHLWVTETNKPACRLYERCGFSPTGERHALPCNPALGSSA
jgi:GNAT superfamily N-acetyltransferase